MAPDRLYPDIDAAALRARAARFERHAEWQRRNPAWPDATSSLAQVAGLYELIPPNARERPVSTEGVAAMHRALAVLR